MRENMYLLCDGKESNVRAARKVRIVRVLTTQPLHIAITTMPQTYQWMTFCLMAVHRMETIVSRVSSSPD
jgi:hypothetical protein